MSIYYSRSRQAVEETEAEDIVLVVVMVHSASWCGVRLDVGTVVDSLKNLQRSLLPSLFNLKGLLAASDSS